MKGWGREIVFVAQTGDYTLLEAPSIFLAGKSFFPINSPVLYLQLKVESTHLQLKTFPFRSVRRGNCHQL